VRHYLTHGIIIARYSPSTGIDIVRHYPSHSIIIARYHPSCGILHRTVSSSHGIIIARYHPSRGIVIVAKIRVQVTFYARKYVRYGRTATYDKVLRLRVLMRRKIDG
jgi:hypothetical protein